MNYLKRIISGDLTPNEIKSLCIILIGLSLMSVGFQLIMVGL